MHNKLIAVPLSRLSFPADTRSGDFRQYYFETKEPNLIVKRSEDGSVSNYQSYYAFIPKTREDGELPAIVVLLHGNGGNWHEFLSMKNLLMEEAERNNTILIVADFTRYGWYLDAAYPDEHGIQNAEKKFFNEVFLPELLHNFQTNGQVGIMGLSMGGHGTVNLAKDNPMIKAAGSMSGVMDLIKGNTQNNEQLLKLLGNKELFNIRWRENSAFQWFEDNVERAKETFWVFGWGGDDHLIEENRALNTLLNNKQIPHKNIGAIEKENYAAYWELLKNSGTIQQENNNQQSAFVINPPADNLGLPQEIKHKLEQVWSYNQGSHTWDYWEKIIPPTLHEISKHLHPPE